MEQKKLTPRILEDMYQLSYIKLEVKGASFHNDWMELLFSTEVLEKYKNVHGLYDMVEGRYDNELSDVTK